MSVMTLKFLFKDKDSISGNCPAVYEAERHGQPGFVIQGKNLGRDQVARLALQASDECGTWMPANVGHQLAEWFGDIGPLPCERPTTFAAEHHGRPGLVLGGKRIGPAELAQLNNRAPDEGATWIPAAHARGIAALYRDRV